MRNLKSLTCISLIALLAACGTPSDGYYDANGNYVPYNLNHKENHDHAPLPGGTASDQPTSYTTTTTTYSYDRPGYYDRNGYYSTMRGVRAPSDMLPPSGMCRIWFANRQPGNQPDIESCDGIQSRVPAGAYVIYGG